MSVNEIQMVLIFTGLTELNILGTHHPWCCRFDIMAYTSHVKSRAAMMSVVRRAFWEPVLQCHYGSFYSEGDINTWYEKEEFLGCK